MSGRATLYAWVTSRLVIMLLFFTVESRVVGDVNYYRQCLEKMPKAGLSHTLVEYPVPAVAVVAIPWLFTRAMGAAAYGLLVLVIAMATDGLFMWALHRASARSDVGSRAVWLLAVPALGAVSYARFDLLPGVLVGLMVLGYQRNARWASAALSLATSVKLWPALLIPALLAASKRRRDVLAPVVVVGALAVGATLVLGGWGRLISPLVYQRDRGLQVEAVGATPAMLNWWLHPGTMRLWFAPSKAWEVTGPGVPSLLQLTSVLTAVFGIALVVVWCRALARGRVLSPEALVWLVLVSGTGFITLGRVLSPQYLLWLAPVAAVGFVVVQRTRALAWWSAGLVTAMLLTQLVFPLLYTSLIEYGPGTGPAVLVLVLRNMIVAVLLATSARQAWRSIGRLGHDEAAQAVVPTSLVPAAEAGGA